MAELLTARQQRLLGLRYGPDGLPIRSLREVGVAVGGTHSSTICREIRVALRKVLRAYYAADPGVQPFVPILEYERLVPGPDGQFRDRPPQRPATRLTWEQVRAIRARHADGQTSCWALAREYGVNPKTIREIVAGRLWREAEPTALPGWAQSRPSGPRPRRIRYTIVLYPADQGYTAVCPALGLAEQGASADAAAAALEARIR